MSVYKETIQSRIIKSILYLTVAGITLLCLIPFVMILSVSLTSDKALTTFGYSLIPKQLSLEAYKFLLSDPSTIVNSYKVTIIVTLSGTILSLLIMTFMAYPLSRKDFRYRNVYAVILFIPMLFNGGLVPWFILCTRYLHLKDNIFALIVPGLVSGFNILLLRNFFATIPDSFHESAKIDGASEVTILFKIIYPLSKPSIATIGLFVTLGYWNDWFTGMMLINGNKLVPLQLMLMKMLNNIDFMRQNSNLRMFRIEFPAESVRMATCLVVIGPIILAYPFFQKYIVKGLMVGGIKG